MFRSLLSCASIFVLLVSTLFSPASISASRCGERMPVTLLSLYRSSQFIYIGTFDRLEEGEPSEQTAGYTIVPTKKYFTLSTSLKGETKKMLVLGDSEYRFKEIQPAVDEGEEVAGETETETTEDVATAASDADESETAENEAGADEVDDAELRPGDSVLLFLNKDEDEGEEGELELVDYSDGLKKMTPEKLAAYEPRIRELNEIFSKAEPSYSEIVAWIVRCAEDPQTRWEGTYELLRSFQYLDLNAARAKTAEEKFQTDQVEADTKRYIPQPPKKFDTGDENFAKELTEGQKLLLTNMLLSRKRPKRNESHSGDGTPGMNRGDRELFDIVKRWGDPEVATYLLDQLRYDSSDPNLNADLMESVSSILADDVLTEIAAQYSDVRWQSDAQVPDAASVSANEARVNVEDEPATANLPTAENAQTDPPVTVGEQKKEPAKTKTFGEIRAGLWKKFLARADRLIAKK